MKARGSSSGWNPIFFFTLRLYPIKCFDFPRDPRLLPVSCCRQLCTHIWIYFCFNYSLEHGALCLLQLRCASWNPNLHSSHKLRFCSAHRMWNLPSSSSVSSSAPCCYPTYHLPILQTSLGFSFSSSDCPCTFTSAACSYIPASSRWGRPLATVRFPPRWGKVVTHGDGEWRKLWECSYCCPRCAAGNFVKCILRLFLKLSVETWIFTLFYDISPFKGLWRVLMALIKMVMQQN